MIAEKDNLIKPERKRTKAEETDLAARAILAAEARARRKKTERLRQLRLEGQPAKADPERRKGKGPSRPNRP